MSASAGLFQQGGEIAQAGGDDRICDAADAAADDDDWVADQWWLS